VQLLWRGDGSLMQFFTSIRFSLARVDLCEANDSCSRMKRNVRTLICVSFPLLLARVTSA
jgi:hypothetical protein